MRQSPLEPARAWSLAGIRLPGMAPGRRACIERRVFLQDGSRAVFGDQEDVGREVESGVGTDRARLDLHASG